MEEVLEGRQWQGGERATGRTQRRMFSGSLEEVRCNCFLKERLKGMNKTAEKENGSHRRFEHYARADRWMRKVVWLVCRWPGEAGRGGKERMR